MLPYNQNLYSPFRGSIDGVIFPWGKRTLLIFPLHFLTLPLYFYDLSYMETMETNIFCFNGQTSRNSEYGISLP